MNVLNSRILGEGNGVAFRTMWGSVQTRVHALKEAGGANSKREKDLTVSVTASSPNHNHTSQFSSRQPFPQPRLASCALN